MKPTSSLARRRRSLIIPAAAGAALHSALHAASPSHAAAFHSTSALVDADHAMLDPADSELLSQTAAALSHEPVHTDDISQAMVARPPACRRRSAGR